MQMPPWLGPSSKAAGVFDLANICKNFNQDIFTQTVF